MAWVAVDKDGTEKIWSHEPEYCPTMEIYIYDITVDIDDEEYQMIILPKGTIEKLIGKKLTWEDEPVELKEKN